MKAFFVILCLWWRAADAQPALLELYTATNGDAWTNNDGWTTDDDTACIDGSSTWHGITCNEDNAVIGIDLSDNNLVGTLPASVFNLPGIQTLIFDNNQVESTGVLPAGAVPLTLQTLSLSGNLIDGQLPTLFCTLLQQFELDEVRLSNNTLTGPVDFGNACLQELRILDFSHNQLTGTIPSGFGSDPNQEILLLNDNQFGGVLPDSLDNDLRPPNIDLSNNFFWCPIPEFESLEHITNECVCPTICEVDDHGVCSEDNLCVCNVCRSGIACEETECPQDPFGGDCYSTQDRGQCSADGCECECVDGYFGDFCEFTSCPNNCSNPPDGEEGEMHGECDTEFGFCECIGNWTGPTELEDCSELVCPKMCSENGMCNRNSNQCRCNSGFFLDDCSLSEIAEVDDSGPASWALGVVFGGIGLLIIALAVVVWKYKKQGPDYAPPEDRSNHYSPVRHDVL